MQMTPWVGPAFIAVLITVAMIADGLKHGMLEDRRGWAGFALFLLSIVVLGAFSYWLSESVQSESRIAVSVAMFFAGVLGVMLGLNIANCVQQSQRMRKHGGLSKREFNRRVDSALAAVQSK